MVALLRGPLTVALQGLVLSGMGPHLQGAGGRTHRAGEGQQGPAVRQGAGQGVEVGAATPVVQGVVGALRPTLQLPPPARLSPVPCRVVW